MLVHSVFFWMKPESSEADRAALRAGLETLRTIECIKGMYVGVPAATPPRPVIDASYDFALTVILDSLADQDIYQAHPVHTRFVDQCSKYWTKVLVYDAE